MHLSARPALAIVSALVVGLLSACSTPSDAPELPETKKVSVSAVVTYRCDPQLTRTIDSVGSKDFGTYTFAEHDEDTLNNDVVFLKGSHNKAGDCGFQYAMDARIANNSKWTDFPAVIVRKDGDKWRLSTPKRTSNGNGWEYFTFGADAGETSYILFKSLPGITTGKAVTFAEPAGNSGYLRVLESPTGLAQR
jgi:hypothetical protein